MKKILTLVCCTILLAATSCTKKYITPANRTVFFTVKGGTNASNPGDWVATNNGGSPAYQVTLGGQNGSDLPELDDFTQHNGAVLVYISFDKGDTYEAVPENFGGASYSFIHSTNTITITSQSSTGGAAVLPTSDMLVKVVLVDSEPQ